MRTTLTIDDDVALALDRIRRERDANFKDVVNEALRRGLSEMTESATKRARFRTKSVSLGRAWISSIDNISEPLAVAEPDAFA